MTELSDDALPQTIRIGNDVLLQALGVGSDQPIGVVTPATKTYSATWTIKGGEAEFWQLIGAFTQGLITGGCSVTAFKCERTQEQSSIQFTLRAGPSHVKRLVAAACEGIEQTAISTGEAERFDKLGPHFRSTRYSHELAKFVGENSAIAVLDCVMKALIETQCRLVSAEGGAVMGGGAVLAVTIIGTKSQVDWAQSILARSLD